VDPGPACENDADGAVLTSDPAEALPETMLHHNKEKTAGRPHSAQASMLVSAAGSANVANPFTRTTRAYTTCTDAFVCVSRPACIAGTGVVIAVLVLNVCPPGSHSQEQGNQACELADAPHQPHSNANQLPPPVDHVQQLILQAEQLQCKNLCCSMSPGTHWAGQQHDGMAPTLSHVADSPCLILLNAVMMCCGID
jgi:hypothetical protein